MTTLANQDTRPLGGIERGMVIVPCLNEAEHIAALVAGLQGPAERLDLKIVVADGGSTDGTREILAGLVDDYPGLQLLDNPRRLQSAAINRAVEVFGDGCDYFIRIDVHGDYPPDYCDRLVEEAASTRADSVVVAMATVGRTPFQQAVALAQNSKLGNGGSAHRTGASGHWTDHGHHALMRIAPFRSVGGYDETFSHNEDAELDQRQTAAGYRIWMTDATVMTYYPRATAGGLFRQYFGYGRGRAKTLLKHRGRPKLRQMAPLVIMPAAAGLILALLHWAAAVPFVVWAAMCVGYGAILGLGEGAAASPLVGIAAMIMHFAWSAGFWLQILNPRNWPKTDAAPKEGLA
ncbi:glycosyltransferase family 2 protein [Consotaella aegiceratis]|uniref:glycosyltransferase family 2 protein n=1 Tax=Consotaella aegiceratis TaxID=3097961 RepID=UPI002F423350